ncbi:MAG: hypothetical protein ABI954_14540 [Pyrinomonadaceae bacterium]
MKRLAPVISFILMAVLLTFNVRPVAACGPSFVVPVFAFEMRPDLELASYASGRIGIIKPNYNRSFLFAAYRNFNDKPFSPAEQKDLVKVWEAELYRTETQESDEISGVKIWIAARKKILPNEPEPKIYAVRQYDGGYDFFPNCAAHAFQIASQTLELRLAAHGANDPALKDWTRAQDIVFSNCSEGKNFPAETAADSPAWLVKDRSYQIAAANFYATNFDDAKTRFENIAADKESVWQPVANYLVARTLIRQASMIEDDDEVKLREKRRPFYEQAEAQLQKILADSSQRQYQPAAVKLLNLIKYRLHPIERVHELAALLSEKGENPNLRQDLIDYRWLLDRLSFTANSIAEKTANDAAKKAGKEYAEDYKVTRDDYSANPLEDDLTDWITTFQSAGAGAFRHSFDKWRETKEPAWLVSAISKADQSNAETTQLIAAAEKSEKTSTAFATLAFHQNRLLVAIGKAIEAKAKLNFLLNNKMTVFPISTRNAFASQRMMLAENLDEFLIDAQRRPAAFAVDGDGTQIEDLAPPKEGEDYNKIEREWQNRMMFDADAVRVFNDQMPLGVLKTAAINSKLPDYLKRNLLIAAWTKAILLGNDVTAQELSSHFANLAPEFSAIFAQYTNAKTPAERSTAALYTLLKFPALRPVAESGYGRLTPVAEIDSYRDNWWCAPTDFVYDNAGEKIELTQMPAPSFLTPTQLAEAGREREQLKKLGNAATYLSRRAVDFAAKFPADARVPESLHLAVKATRYGCTDCDTGKFSKAAHDLLKSRFPGSEWQKKTPYWFKDESCEQK